MLKLTGVVYTCQSQVVRLARKPLFALEASDHSTAVRKIFALASVFVGFVNTLMKLQSNLQKQLQKVD